MYRPTYGRQGSDGYAVTVATAAAVVSDATASDAAARPPDAVIIISYSHLIVNRNSTNFHVFFKFCHFNYIWGMGFVYIFAEGGFNDIVAVFGRILQKMTIFYIKQAPKAVQSLGDLHISHSKNNYFLFNFPTTRPQQLTSEKSFSMIGAYAVLREIKRSPLYFLK